MGNNKKTKYTRHFGAKKLIWNPCPGESEMTPCQNVYFYSQKLTEACYSNNLQKIAEKILQEEFSNLIKEAKYYELFIHLLTNRLCTMQSIKNVLSYKEEYNIKQIQDVRFNNGEVQLTCLI